MICRSCREAADNRDASGHRECAGPERCLCQHRGRFPCRCGEYLATSIPDIDEHVAAMMNVEDEKQHGER